MGMTLKYLTVRYKDTLIFYSTVKSFSNSYNLCLLNLTDTHNDDGSRAIIPPTEDVL